VSIPKNSTMPCLQRATNLGRFALWRAARCAQAGLPIETPALTVNRLCGSGMQSLVNAAQMIQLGEAKTVFGGRDGIHVTGGLMSFVALAGD